PSLLIEPAANAEAGVPLPADASADVAEAGGAVAGEAGTGEPIDGGVADAVGDGAAPLPLPRAGPSGRVAGLALMPDASRGFVGMGQSPFVLAFDLQLDSNTGNRRLVSLDAAGRLPLVENPIGVTKLRLSVDPFAAGKGGNFVGRRGRFLYAFARDGSVRVLALLPGARVAQECDANVLSLDVLTDGCAPVNAGHPRLPFARGPGIRVPATRATDIEPALPIDIAFAEVNASATGFLLTSTGAVMQISLGDSQAFTGTADDSDKFYTHQFRSAPVRQGSRSGGEARLDVEPTRNFTTTDVPFPTKVAPEPTQGPRLEPFSPPQSGPNIWVSFPQNVAVPPQGVRIEWEGLLPGARRRNGRLAATETPAPGDAVGTLSDVGANFCAAGVEVGDIVTLVGCSEDNNCDPLQDEICYRALPGGPGVCVPRAMAADEQRMRACRLEFSSRRRYEVKQARRTELRLGLKLDEVERPAVAPCQLGPGGTAADDPVCQPDPSHAADSRIEGDRGFSCQPFSDRPRCVKPCGLRMENGQLMIDQATGRPVLRDDVCRPGHVCADVGEAAVGPVCVEGPAPTPACLTGELRYAVQAGRAYRVTTEALPQFLTQTELPGGLCVPLPNRDPRFTDRIRLDAPLCPTAPEQPISVSTLGNFVWRTRPSPANPCLFRSANTDEPATANANPPPLKALFENPYMRFVLTDIDDYVGDVAIINFQILGGFEPLTATGTGGAATDIALGARIVTGPIAARGQVVGTNLKPPEDIPVPPYLFVIDQGRTLRELSRGQLLRLNPRPWVNNEFYGGFFDSVSTNTPWPIQ
ncbi:MAG TPA: hypothetical protein VGF45_10920, partial [Polyangia bacterium]